MRSVLPSPGDWATKSAPIWPLAPGLFSTITGSFQISESFGAMRRARASSPPPGGKGTTMRTWQKALPNKRRERTRTKSFMGRRQSPSMQREPEARFESGRSVAGDEGLHHLVSAVGLGPGLAGPLVLAVGEHLELNVSAGCAVGLGEFLLHGG